MELRHFFILQPPHGSNQRLQPLWTGLHFCLRTSGEIRHKTQQPLQFFVNKAEVIKVRKNRLTVYFG
jgi:hypothetical protein